MTKMNKTKTALVLLIIASLAVMMVALVPSTPSQVRADATKTYLGNSLPISPTNPGYYDPDEDFVVHVNIPTIGGTGEVFWHFVDASGGTLQAFVKFEPIGGGDVITSTLDAYKLVGSTHYGVNTPKSYKLIEAYLIGVVNGPFVLSHTYYENNETTAAETTAQETTSLETTAAQTTAQETTASETTSGPTTAQETTEVLATTVVQTSVEQTTAQETTTYIELTTESVPLSSTVVELTTESIPLSSTVVEPTTIVLTTEAIPQTGETSSSNNGLIIGLTLLLLAGGLTFVVYRKNPAEG